MKKQLREIQDLDISTRLRNLLVSAGIRFVKDLNNYTEDELVNDFGFGLKSMAELIKVINRYDVYLKKITHFRTYTLIQIYPGSPIHGTLAKTYEEGDFYTYKEPISNNNYLISKENVEKYPLNWRRFDGK